MEFLRKFGITFVTVLASLFFLVGVVYAATVTWSETQPAGNTDQNWASVKISRDGAVILAGINSGRLYVSRDSGATWEEARPAGDDDFQWLVTAVSGDGQTMLAGNYGGRLYISHDAGRTWADTQAAGDADSSWQGGAISGDGQTILAGVNPGRLYISTNGGSTWSETRPAGNNDKNWIPMALNDNGQIILAGVYGGRMYRSANQGSSWSEIRPDGDNDYNWLTVGLDKDGQTMLVGIDDAGDEISPRNGKLYLSQDGGNSWSEKVLAGTYGREWRISSISDDGKRMLVGYGDSTTAGRIFLSTNSGSTWSETQPAGDADYLWKAGVLSGDGYTMVVAAGTYSATSRMYIGTLPRPGPVINNAQPPGCASTQPGGQPDLFQIDTTSDKAKLYFTPVSSNADKYVISFGYTPGDMRFGAELSGNSTGVMSYTINALSPSSTYYVRVRAGNGCATGEWSNEMKFTTASKGSTSGKRFFENFPSQIIFLITHLVNF